MQAYYQVPNRVAEDHGMSMSSIVNACDRRDTLISNRSAINLFII
jgi:hypothetical protein